MDTKNYTVSKAVTAITSKKFISKLQILLVVYTPRPSTLLMEKLYEKILPEINSHLVGEEVAINII